jgi:hypothetical protein
MEINIFKNNLQYFQIFDCELGTQKEARMQKIKS